MLIHLLKTHGLVNTPHLENEHGDPPRFRLLGKS